MEEVKCARCVCGGGLAWIM